MLPMDIKEFLAATEIHRGPLTDDELRRLIEHVQECFAEGRPPKIPMTFRECEKGPDPDGPVAVFPIEEF